MINAGVYKIFVETAMKGLREPKNPSAFIKFRLLMWKNFLQQWRHRYQTVVEVLLPVLTMALILILRSQVEPENRAVTEYRPFRAYSLNNSALVIAGMNITEMSLAYSPENQLLDDILRTAMANLLIQNVDVILPILEMQYNISVDSFPDMDLTAFVPVIKNFVKLQPYESSADLTNLYAREEVTRQVIAAVQFDDSLRDVSALPSDVSYSLRFPERPRLNQIYGYGARTWRTDAVFPAFETIGPRYLQSNTGGNDPGYIVEAFIALQHTISSELISRLTNNVDDIQNYEVFLQRYPHPPYLEDLAVEILQLFFSMFIIISFSYTAVNIARAITVEKELQLKETMKIMGLPTWLHWTAWFCKQFTYLAIVSVLIVVLLKTNWFVNEEGFGEYAVMTNTPWTVILFFLLLYLACTIFFCFMLSTFFSSGNTAALFTGILWFMSSIPAIVTTMDLTISPFVQGLTCLSINAAATYGFRLLLAKESSGGVQWGEFFSSPASDDSRFLFGHVVLMLFLDCVLYMLIALYVEQVYPGTFGTPKPWYFPFQKHFWFPNSKIIPAPDAYNYAVDYKNVTMEKDPIDLDIGVKMSNLTKVYGHNVAVNNLSLNIYEDQITVLLGHNGAGKSTTISMLTGNVEVTSGSVTLAGYDISRQTVAARANLGLCPQHNVLFNELTVREHFEFFSRLKGFTGEELTSDIDEMIEKLELQDKRDYLASGLSGGQKRRVCVGIALCGGVKVVLLDEPTSGMDPASRRALWDLLQKEKRGRSMILTTHFMDEADILGDRVAIMAHGTLQCVGSPYFLKQHYGVGYTLVVVKTEDFRHEACNALINRHIPHTTIKEDRGSEITYNLANDLSHKFEDMLIDLEKHINVIRYKNYGLIATTMEDVFMSVGSDAKSASSRDSDDTTTDASTEDMLRYDSYEHFCEEVYTPDGTKLIWQHVRALWMKLWLMWIRSPLLLLLQVLTPILVVNAVLGVLYYFMSLLDSVQMRPLTLAQGYTNTETYVTYNGSAADSFGSLATTAYETMFNTSGVDSMQLTVVRGQSVDDYYLEQGAEFTEMGRMRHRVLIGATISDTSAVSWFSNFAYHDVATSLATLHSALLGARVPGATLQVFNHPLQATYSDTSDMQLMVALLAIQLAQAIGNSLGVVSAVFIMFYIKERVSRANLLQRAAGVEPLVLWGSAAIFDWFWFIVICISLPLSCLAFDVSGLSTFAELGRMYLCVMAYGAAMLPLNYLCSHLFKGPALGFVVMYFVNVLLGLMGAMIVESLSSPVLDTERVAYILDMVLQFFPLYSCVTAIRELNKIGMTVDTCMTTCEQVITVFPNVTECSLEVMCQLQEMCCVREDAYLEWSEPGILRYIVCMFLSCGIFWLVLLIVEYRVLEKVFNREKKPPPVDISSLDDDVADEFQHVQRIGSDVTQHSLVANNLTKYYGQHLAVDQVSFTVSDSECFGLLGVNGAGKTTTFKMLMGDESVSNGDAFISGHSVKTSITKVHENIGYCPQFDAVFGELTGRENLRLYAALRGLTPPAAEARTIALANQLGFIQHIDKRVDQYSGGNKRKLSTAIALLGRTRLVFVDEPTTGVDPAAKRQVWRALRSVQGVSGADSADNGRGETGRTGRGVVLTSHSMEECEALCSRLTIMVNGRFQCLGTPQHLKNKFSQGFTLIVKMKVDDRESPSNRNTNAMDTIKSYINSHFKLPKLMEEYQGLLTYYLSDRSIPWSKMFGTMERAKRELGVEDYSISQTTLEQIFLQFTKYQRV